MEGSEGYNPGNEFRQEVGDRIGFIPTTTTQTLRFMRGTNIEEAQAVALQGYGLDNMGFQGNAVGLSKDPDHSIAEMQNTHRGASIVLLFALPNIRPEVVRMIKGGKLPRDFRVETLFSTTAIDPSRVRSSGSTPNPSIVLDSRYVEGYYDKDQKSWHPNPNYWENVLSDQAKKKGWSPEEYTRRREETAATIHQEVIAHLKQAASDYQTKNDDLSKKYDQLLNPDLNNKKPLIRIP